MSKGAYCVMSQAKDQVEKMGELVTHRPNHSGIVSVTGQLGTS